MATAPASMAVAHAAKMAADSIVAIDQRVLAVSQIPPVDTGVLPNLKADLGQLTTTLSTWPASVRPQAIQSLRQALAADTTALAPWTGIDRQNQHALLGFADSLWRGVGNADGAIAKLVGVLAPFRTAVDQSVSGLRTDVDALNQQIGIQQQLAKTFADEVAAAEKTIYDFNHMSGWEAFAWGLTIVGGIIKITQAKNAEAAAQEALTQACDTQSRLQHLSNALGPLLSLSTATALLGVCSSNMQTAVSQVANTLNDIIQQKPLPAILSAQLQTIVEDLTSADAIITQVVNGS